MGMRKVGMQNISSIRFNFRTGNLQSGQAVRSLKREQNAKTTYLIAGNLHSGQAVRSLGRMWNPVAIQKGRLFLH
jgi:hypothetical protein